VEVHEREFSLIKSGEVSAVEPKAFRVLIILLRNPQKLISKDELLQAVWGDAAVTENSLTRSIALLRRLLGDDTRNPRYIETVTAVGYRFLCPVEVAEDPSAQIEGAATVEPAAKELVPAGPPPGPVATPVAAASKLNRKLILAIAAMPLLIAVWFLVRHFAQPGVPSVASVVRLTSDGKGKIPINGPFTDGVHLYFMEGTPWGSGSGIAQVAAVGGETTWITTTMQKALAIVDISPDKSKLLIVRGSSSQPGSEFWIQPLPAGTPYRLGNLVLTGSSVSWTPDGAHIIYGYQHKVWIANEDGSAPSAIAEVPGNARWFRFSPDGRLLRFSVLDATANSSVLWEMHPDGTSLHPLLPNWKEAKDQCCGRWSSTGDYFFLNSALYFEVTPDPAIWVIPAQRLLFHRNNPPVRLTAGPLRFGAPTPSLDGKSVFAIGEEIRVELFSYEPQTRRLDPYLGGLSASGVASSPDGKWIAWISYPDMALWKSRPDLSEKMQLTFPPVRAYGPRWSPEGSKIAFTDEQPHRPWQAFVISSAGGDSPKQIAQSNIDDADSDPTWAPDGKSIVFARSGPGGQGKSSIYRVDLTNGNLVQIPGPIGLTSPRLSPDGQYIAAFAESEKKLVLFEQKTNSWSALAEGNFGYNEWSPDGKYVYVRESSKGFARIIRIGIKDRAVEEVLSLKDFPQIVDIYAGWYGLTPDGKLLLMRDRSVQEIYAISLERK
jgi:DNA-binding winged helix-turn-helix (wHTH) protein/Tol biopolymer transport system component